MKITYIKADTFADIYLLTQIRHEHENSFCIFSVINKMCAY